VDWYEKPEPRDRDVLPRKFYESKHVPREDGLPTMLPYTRKRLFVLLVEKATWRLLWILPGGKIPSAIALWLYTNSPWEEYK
jgi:hypothetical protein